MSSCGQLKAVILPQNFPLSWTPVVELLALRRPATVRRLVIAIIVDAVNRMLIRRPRSHIAIESLEACSPAFADADSAPSVMSKHAALWICAALDHFRPNSVLGQPRQAMTLIRTLALMASARGGRPAQKQTRRHDPRAATATFANPGETRPRSLGNDSQIAECLAREIGEALSDPRSMAELDPMIARNLAHSVSVDAKSDGYLIRVVAISTKLTNRLLSLVTNARLCHRSPIQTDAAFVAHKLRIQARLNEERRAEHDDAEERQDKRDEGDQESAGDGFLQKKGRPIKAAKLAGVGRNLSCWEAVTRTQTVVARHG